VRVITFFREMFRQYPVLLTATSVCLLLVGLMDAAAIFSLAPVVDVILHPDLKVEGSVTRKVINLLSSIGVPITLAGLLCVFLLFNVCRTGFYILARHLILRAKYGVLRDLVISLCRDFLNARWKFFTGSAQGTLLNTLTREIQTVGDGFAAMAIFFANVVQIGLYLTVPLFISWQVTCVSLGVALVFAGPFFLLGKISHTLGRRNTITGNRFMSMLQESFASAKVVIGFGKSKSQVQDIARSFDAHRQATLKSQTLALAVPLTYYPLGLLVIVVAMLYSRKLMVPFSETTIILYSLIRVLPLVGQLPGQKTALDIFFPSYEQVKRLRDEATSLRQPSGTRKFPGIRNEIRLEDVSFTHFGHQPVLSHIDITIPKGKMVAFVGESGSGKTTLGDIIMGFYAIDSGKVLIDGTELEEFDIISYRRKIGYVPQDSVLFNMSIKENLLWANEQASDEQMRDACRTANAHSFIEEFPYGYNTVVGDRGIRLSGGQLQRIALARAILIDPDLLILDEATSALDTHSERLIQQSIEKVSKKTTVVVIAHRLSTIVNADYIYVIEKGQVVEEGTYTELCRVEGRFKHMTDLQVAEPSP
jgi:ABC-type multidrug transport system fused ATPase/permease subunit